MLKTKSNKMFTAVAAVICLFISSMIFNVNLGQVAAGELPPRPETPTPAPAANPSLNGAAIILQLSGAVTGPEGVWTVVEWQDPDTEVWHVVEGWQGTVESDGSQMWWVGTSNFDTGPFRWVIYESKEGSQIGMSEPFQLPKENRQKVMVEVDL